MQRITGSLESGTTNPAPPIDCWIPERGNKGIGLVILATGKHAHGCVRSIAGAPASEALLEER